MGEPTADCIFCDIAAGIAEASVVRESERTLAFMDLHPVTRGHLLVVPRAHMPYLADIDPETSMELFEEARQAAAMVYASDLKPEGVNLFLADGEVAGQEVFHAHVHVIPRYTGDGFGLKLPPGYPTTAERSALDELARVIRGG